MKLKNQNILVTGGAGFIGGHLVETLSHDNQVVVYDNFSSSVFRLGDLSHLGNLRVIPGDILDQKNLSRTMAGIDIVFHLAVSGVRASLSNPKLVHDTNCTGTLTTLLAAQKAGVKRFIYISSSEVYGNSNEPTTVYGESKRMGERYTLLFHREEKLPAVVIRPFNTYGPRSHFDGMYGEVIPRTVIRVLAGKPPIIFGDGKQTRTFTYVDDTVRGIIASSQTDSLVGKITDIASREEVSIQKLVQIICKIIGVSCKPIFHPPRPHDIRRLAARTDFSARISLEEGLARYITWVKNTYPDKNKLLRLIPEKNW